VGSHFRQANLDCFASSAFPIGPGSIFRLSVFRVDVTSFTNHSTSDIDTDSTLPTRYVSFVASFPTRVEGIHELSPRSGIWKPGVDELSNLESEGIHELETLDAIKHRRQDQRQRWTRIRGVIEAKNK
jgi:hypothetical protein